MVVPAGVQLTLVSATMPTSLPDILGNIVDVRKTEIHSLDMHIL